MTCILAAGKELDKHIEGMFYHVREGKITHENFNVGVICRCFGKF